MKKLLALVLSLFATATSAQVFQYYGPANGIQKNTGSTYQDTAAVSADIAALWVGTNCGTSTNVPLLNGNCAVPSTGSVTSVGFSDTSTTPIYTIGSTPVTTSGVITQTLTTQSANTGFMGPTTGVAAQPTFRALVSADIPPINLGSTANGGVSSSSILLGTNGGTSNGFFSITGPATSLKTFTFPNASANVLTDNALVTVAQGGTGIGSLTNHGVLLGQGTSAVTAVAAMAADTLLQGQGTTSNPAAVSVNNCGSSTQALSYSTSTHTFGCQTISAGTGTVTSITAGTGITASPNPIVSTGTVSVDQAFSPTWSGTHTFSNAITVNGAGSSLKGAVTIATPTSGVALTVDGFQNWITAGANFSITPNTSSGSNGVTLATSFTSGGNGPIILAPGGTTSLTDSANGNVTIAAPASGVALSASGLANSNVATFTASSTSGQSKGLGIAAGTTSADYALLVTNQAASATYAEIFGDGHGTLGPSASLGLSWATTGDVTIAAPSSGTAFSVTGAANTNTVNFQASSTTGQSLGLQSLAGTNSSDFAFRFYNFNGTTQVLLGFGDGGVIAGNPTGGDKGVGTINMQGCFVNGLTCLTTSSGAATKIASGVFTTNTPGTINQNGGGISSITFNSTGNVTINFTASYFSTFAVCTVSTVNGASPPLVATTPGTIGGTGSVNVLVRASGGTATDGSFSLICTGT